MRAARMIAVGAAVLLATAACGGGLTEAEQAWCEDLRNQGYVFGAFGELFGDDPIQDEFTVAVENAWPQGVPPRLVIDFFRENYPSEYERSCKKAFESR